MMRKAKMYACVRCGKPSPDEHCGQCDAAYYAHQQDSYEAGEPYPVQVGSAFGGPVCISVSKEAANCGCRGGGWHYTDLDSIHQCPQHYRHQPHPECGEPDVKLTTCEGCRCRVPAEYIQKRAFLPNEKRRLGAMEAEEIDLCYKCSGFDTKSLG